MSHTCGIPVQLDALQLQVCVCVGVCPLVWLLLLLQLLFTERQMSDSLDSKTHTAGRVASWEGMQIKGKTAAASHRDQMGNSVEISVLRSVFIKILPCFADSCMLTVC